MKKPRKKPSSRQLALGCCLQIIAAYNAGTRNCDHIDWNDIDDAYVIAKAAIRAWKRERKK